MLREYYFSALIVLVAAVAVGCGGASYPRAKVVSTLLHDGEFAAMAYSADGKYLAGGTAGGVGTDDGFWKGKLYVWGTSKFEVHKVVDCPTRIKSISISDEASVISIGGGNPFDASAKQDSRYLRRPGFAALYTFPDLKQLKSFSIGDMVHQTVLTRDGATLAISASWSAEERRANISFWSGPHWKKVATFGDDLARPDRFFYPISLSADNSAFLVYLGLAQERSTEVRKLSIKGEHLQQKTIVKLQGDINVIEGAFPTARIDEIGLLSVNAPRIVKIADGRDCSLPAFLAKTRLTADSCLSSDKRWLVCALRRGNGPTKRHAVLIWDLENHKQIAYWESDEEAVPTSVAISPNKKHVAVSTARSYQTSQGTIRGKTFIYQTPQANHD